MIPAPDLSSLSPAAKDELILTLIERLNALEARVACLEKENAALRKENADLRKENAELRAKLGQPPKTPDNSSTPPSQGRKPSAQAAPKAKGKRKSRPGKHRPLHANPSKRLDVPACCCQHCATDVSGEKQTAREAYDRIEIPPVTAEITRVTLMGGICPACGKPYKAPAPEGMEPGSPFGPNLTALALHLRYTQGIGFERLSHLFSHVFSLSVSEGALVNMIQSSRDAFAAQTARIRQDLFAKGVMESDETTMRVGKKNWWLWVFHHADSAMLTLKPSRAKTVVAEFLGGYRPNIWVSDRYGAQAGWAVSDSQVCLAHLIRDAQYAIDAGDKVFAPGLKRLLSRACAIGRRRGRLKDSTLRTYLSELEARLDQLLERMPVAKAGVKLQRAIKKCRCHLFVFMTNRTVPATNNGSERSLRPCAVFRKITNCFRSEWGAAFYADIRSVIETARRRGIGALEAIRLTLAGRPLAQAP
jgi:transposase